MNIKHTPGLWRITDHKTKPTVGTDRHVVCYINIYAMGEQHANARLIAAAPDLLAALRGLMEYTGGWDSPADHPCGIARDALTKAIGETL